MGWIPEPSGVTDHGNLTGLEDDDHPQYLTEAEHGAINHPHPTYAETIGDGSTTEFTVTHNLDTTYVVAQVWDASGSVPVYAQGDPSQIEVVDADSIKVTFSVAPDFNDYRVVIVGIPSGSVTPPDEQPPPGITWHSLFWAEGSEFEALGLDDGDAVATWPDEENSHDATQSTAARRPLYWASAIGGRPAVQFDSEADQALETATFTAVSQPVSAFVVAMVEDMNAVRVLAADATFINIIGVNGAGNFICNFGTAIASTHEEPDFLFHRFVGIGNGGSSVFRIDGGENTGNGGTRQPTQWNLGGDRPSGEIDGNHESINGFIAFAGIKDGEFTSQEITDLEAWAETHYGLATSQRAAVSLWSSTSNPRAIALDGTVYVGAGTRDGASILELEDGVVVGSHTFSVTDDTEEHVQPAILIKESNPPVAFYANHDSDNTLRYRIGSQNIESGMAWGSEQTIGMGGATTYAVIVEHDGDLWAFTRVASTTWRFVKSTDWGSNWSSPQTIFSGATNNLYMHIAKAGSTLRVITDEDPGTAMYYFEIDLDTGAITDGTTGLGNLDGTSLPLGWDDGQQAASTAEDGHRFYGISDAADPEIVWADWDTADQGGTSTYRYGVRSSGTWSTKSIVAAGEPFTGSARTWLGEADFSPSAPGGTLVLVRENAGTWTVEEYTTADGGDNWSSETLATSTKTTFGRPHYINDLDSSVTDEVVVGRVYRFDELDDWWARLEVL